MPLILNQEEEDTGYNIFSNNNAEESLQSNHARGVVEYSQFPQGRVNKDLRNEVGENEVKQIESEEGFTNFKASFSEIKRGEDKKETEFDPRDTNKDGEVSWGETFKAIPNQSYESVKSAVSQAGATIQSGVEKSLSGAKKVALNIGDVDGDGDIDIHDLGEAVRSTGNNIREATGINAVASGMKDSGDKITSQMIMVGGAIVLAYLLVKS